MKIRNNYCNYLPCHKPIDFEFEDIGSRDVGLAISTIIVKYEEGVVDGS